MLAFAEMRLDPLLTYRGQRDQDQNQENVTHAGPAGGPRMLTTVLSHECPQCQRASENSNSPAQGLGRTSRESKAPKQKVARKQSDPDRKQSADSSHGPTQIDAPLSAPTKPI